MVENMKIKFSNDILAIEVVLDPRMKFDIIPSICEENISHLKVKIYKVFKEYENVRSYELTTSNS
ncbi:hypothetical protein CR513_32919, partial [Mucuna pruriens]